MKLIIISSFNLSWILEICDNYFFINKKIKYIKKAEDENNLTS